MRKCIVIGAGDFDIACMNRDTKYSWQNLIFSNKDQLNEENKCKLNEENKDENRDENKEENKDENKEENRDEKKVENIKENREDGDDAFYIAVDGGLCHFKEHNMEPDLIIGDFDSVTKSMREQLVMERKKNSEKIVVLAPEKDDTDMLAALKIGLEKGFREFILYGATGGRLEHSFANIQCLLYLKEHGANGTIIDEKSLIFILKDEELILDIDEIDSIGEQRKVYLSIFAMGKKTTGVNIQGMKYNLKDTVITNDFPIGISNEFIGEKAIVSVKEGELLVVISRK